MARSEGRPLQALIDEVLREYVTRKQGHAPRPNVMTVFYDSLRQYEDLYRKLAE